ncbi:MAG: hypothetical protein IAE77_24465 [Prosthecobacter sp.]|jgi:hypothetical protein|uniref:hypothetical protein n=1 Tax=Prosthecobacter sp. TaxID=1965333 RepID=UPI0019F05990|nr:hypothetical protein [Prosthecobacter sp.]MBE2286632.1 hypothetical protein [Prosthecobacter sp.]
MKHPLPVLLRVLPALAGTVLHAQTAAPADPQALTTARAAFLRQVMTDSQLLTEQYARALAKAEVDVAATGDYEEARAIRQRLEQLKALYAGTASSLATPLPLAQARLSGSTQSAGEMLSGWRSNGSGAEWTNFRVVPGRYHLEFEVNMSDSPVAGSIYASSKFQPQQSALFEFNEVTLLGNASDNRRTFEITRSTDETTFTTVRAGPLTFTHSPVSLHFGNKAGYPANIIRIRNLRLVPVTEENAAPATPATAASTTILQQSTAALNAALDAAKKAADASYIEALQSLAAAKPVLKKQTEAEARRVEKLGQQRTGIAGIHAVASSSGSFAGFENITEAYLAEGEPLAGDRFQVVHEGRTLQVRLLWVNCASPEENDPGEAAFAKYFGIDDEDVAGIGRYAREFTAGFLRDKPLRLLVRPDPDQDGTLAALVFLPDVGLFQNVLIDHGLAAISPPPTDSRRNAPEKALLTTMDARERAAKKRKPAPGAWALASAAQGGRK